MENKTLQNLRQEYQNEELGESTVQADPIRQFELWFQEAMDAGVPEPNAMTLATANIDFKPAARIVLLKGIEDGSFVFFTNYNSRKGKELLWNPYATLLFFWSELSRQVRIEGRVAKISEQASEEYFRQRPFGSQVGALVSPQSEVISGREVLDRQMAALEKEYEGKAVPRPPHWGGYKVIPNAIEFWQGRLNRLHDRLLYTLAEDNQWNLVRLAP
jgi:pyridoxamine 5'-phosphate oxidase